MTDLVFSTHGLRQASIFCVCSFGIGGGSFLRLCEGNTALSVGFPMNAEWDNNLMIKLDH